MNKEQKKQYDKLVAKDPVPYGKGKSNSKSEPIKKDTVSSAQSSDKKHVSFSDCPFKVSLPRCVNGELQISFSCNFVYKSSSNPLRVAFQKAVFRNFKGEEYISGNELKMFDIHKVQSSINGTIFVENKQNFYKSFLELVFISTEKRKYSICYKLDYPDKVMLHEIKTYGMSSEEIKIFEKLLLGSNSDRKSSSTSILKDSDKFPNIYKYLSALNKERKFLMGGGGKKYRATNGRYVTSDQGVYYYFFELEAELHLADDSPINITVNGVDTRGAVLACENFQIVVALNSYIGEIIAVAYINAEPWKLLEALHDSVKKAVYDEQNPMVMMLLNKGPDLATNDSITKVATGQKTAIAMSENNPVTVIWGPPGTGKTHTMAKYAVNCIEADKKVLIVSHSNVSVDGVTKKIYELMCQDGNEEKLKDGKVLRYGYVRDEELQKNDYVRSFAYAESKFPDKKKALEHKRETLAEVKRKHGLNNKEAVGLTREIGELTKAFKEIEGSFVSKANVVATTISKVSVDKLFDGRMYDVVMFDEISMANIPQVICAASHAKTHFVCVGDFMQLSPIAQSDAQHTLSEDIFNFLKISDGIKFHNHPWLVMLNVQRRMHPDISKFPNSSIYRNLLKNHKSTIDGKNHIVNADPFSGHAINLVDLDGSYCAAWKNSDNSRFNILSALISFSTAICAEAAVDNVSIITPYAAQTRLIRALILDYRDRNESIEIRCATVHQFQGSESDAIVFDAVESFPKKKAGWLLDKDFSEVQRLINVAITRARGKFITVANARFWKDNYTGTQHTLYRLITHIEKHGHVVRRKEASDIDDYIKSLSVEKGPEFYLQPSEYMDRLITDIDKAKNSIIVSLPSSQLELCEGFDGAIAKAGSRGVSIMIKYSESEDLPDFWKKNGSLSEDAVFPLIIIDDRITWYGAPQADWKFKDKNKALLTPCKVACRINGKYTAEIIKALTSIELNSCGADGGGAGSNTSGLSEYVATHRYCKSCHKPLKLTKGKSGKAILWCSDCKSTELLHPDEINAYLALYDVNCPECGGELKAGLGKYGLYVRWEDGHFPKLEKL